MTHTQDFEYLLEKENVKSVDWDGEKVIIRVSKKLPESELADDDIVNLQTEHDVEVIDEGEARGKGYFELESSNPENRHRPVVAGVSEGHRDITAGTASVYPVEVSDTGRGKWSDDVTEGDHVRLSNNHVYAKVNNAEFGDRIFQPGPHDGGAVEDTTGRLAGYVEIEDGVTVDVAARTTDSEVDSEEIHELEDYNTGVIREGYGELTGTDLTKSGRTTKVTVGTVNETSASVNVRIDDGTVLFRDMIITDDMSEGGDSGSPVFVRESGEMVGLLFAGSSTSTIFCKAGNVEKELGVKILSEDDNPPDDPPEEDSSFIEWLLDILDWIFG